MLNADGLPQGLLVDALSHILSIVAHEQRGDAGGHLHVLDGAAHLAAGLVDDLAVLDGDCLRDLLEVVLHGILEAEHVGGAGHRRGLAPFQEGLLGRLHGGVRLGRGGHGLQGHRLGGGGIDHLFEARTLGISHSPLT
jgi:hypothetical protein